MKSQKVKKICKQAFDELVAAVEAGKSETLLQYLRVMGRFHRYSFGNQMLIQMQRKDAEHVAGFWTWKKLGRSVKKGAKGIAIMATLVYKKKHADIELENDEELLDLETIRTFKTVYVFDIKDTQGRPLPEFAQVSGEPGVYLERLRAYVDFIGVNIETKPLSGTTQGYASNGLIVLKSNLSQAESCSTLIHELAHQLLHIRQEAKDVDRNIRELEAEAVAYTVGSGIGLDMGTSSCDYIQLYNGKKEDLMASLRRVQTTSSEILDAITSDQKEAKAA